MKTIKMFKSLPFIALALALVITLLASLARAQDKKALDGVCRVKVRILNFNWANSSESVYDRLSANQTEWWLKEGQKKFPGVCITTESGVADYVIAWADTSESFTYTYQVPKTETTEHRGTINSTSTSTGTLDSVNSSGTYRGTSTTTRYEDKQGERSVWYVNAFVHRLIDKPVEIDVNGQKEIGKAAEKLPAFISKHKGQWRWSKPDKDAFEKAIKFVAAQAK